jgi:hypothetical protein
MKKTSIETLLNEPCSSFLIHQPGNNKKLLVAAPHHAPLGVEQLPCETHPKSDENTGWIAYHLSQRLDCGCLIAGNYFIDPNKHKTSDYYKRIEMLQPTILIEIHGHGSGSAKFDIEISSGSRDKSHLSQQLANHLQQGFAGNKSLKNYTISGDFEEIHFRATKSLTINTHQWTAFHIELPQRIREDEHQYLLFCDFVKEAIFKIQ